MHYNKVAKTFGQLCESVASYFQTIPLETRVQSQFQMRFSHFACVFPQNFTANNSKTSTNKISLIVFFIL